MYIWFCVLYKLVKQRRREITKSWLISMIYFKVMSNMVHVKIDRELQVKWYEQEKATEPKNMVHYRTYGMLRTVDASFSSWYLCLWLCFILILNIFLFISRNFGSSYLLLGTFSFNFRIGKCNVRWDFRRWIIYFPQVIYEKKTSVTHYCARFSMSGANKEPNCQAQWFIQ